VHIARNYTILQQLTITDANSMITECWSARSDTRRHAIVSWKPAK